MESREAETKRVVRLVTLVGAAALTLHVAVGCGDKSSGGRGDGGIQDGQTSHDAGLNHDGDLSDGGQDTDAGPICEAPEYTEPPQAFFVAADAPTGGTGSVDSPLATLDEARDAIEALDQLPEDGVTVYLRSGVYHRTSSFELTADDSGTADATITYRNYPCETVRIVGGKEVTGWQKLTSGSVYDRLPAEAQGQVYVLDLAGQGIDDYGQILQLSTYENGDPHARVKGPAPLELFIDGKAMRLARYPNLTPKGDNGWIKSSTGTSGSTLGYDGTRPSDRNWQGDAANGNPIMVRSFLHWYFADCLSAVTNIDRANKQITLDQTCGSLREDHYCYVYNLLEELDEPGEYWLDRAAGKLYFWPPASFDANSEVMVSLLEDPLVHGDGVEHLVFRGIQFEMTRGRGIYLEDCGDITFHRCTIANVGRTGLDTTKGSLHASPHIVFSRGDIFSTGETAMSISGGNRSSLTPSGNLVTDSHIHSFGRLLAGTGVRIGHSNRHGCGATLQYSIVEKGSGLCVSSEAPMSTIEHNIIRGCAKDTGDLGAVYWGYSDPANRGTVLRYNIIGNTHVLTKPWEGHGSAPYSNNCVYVDGMGSGGDVSMNLIYDCDEGVHVNGGKFHHFVNNIFYRNKAVRRISCAYREPAGTYNPGVQAMIDAGIADLLWHSNVRNWTDHADPWTPNESWADQLSPYDTVEELQALIGNVGYRSTGYYVGNIEWDNGTYYADTPYEGCPWDPDENNLKDVDPLFVDEDASDFRLLPNSPAADMSPAFPIDEWNAMIQLVGPRPDTGD